MKLTDWSKPGAKPEREGPYLVWGPDQDEDREAMSYWDGKAWSIRAFWTATGSAESSWSDMLRRAYEYCGDYTYRDASAWRFRGLAEDPNLPPSEPTHV